MEDDTDFQPRLTQTIAALHRSDDEKTAAKSLERRGVGDLYGALARTIECDVVPRLLLRTRIKIAIPDVAASTALQQAFLGVPTFCDIILSNDVAEAQAFISKMSDAGASRESILLDLFAPAARHLGKLWDADARSFVEVTLALGTLQQVLRRFSEMHDVPAPANIGLSALLANLPGDTHVFGLLVVEELFRQSGWSVLSLPSPQHDDLLRVVAQEWFAVVGLSISRDDSGSVKSLIADIRTASLNTSVLVLVGGRYVVDNPDAAAIFGADVVGADAIAAVERSRRFIGSIGR